MWTLDKVLNLMLSFLISVLDSLGQLCYAIKE